MMQIAKHWILLQREQHICARYPCIRSQNHRVSRLRTRKKKRRGKDCRRSSNFAGLIFNNRKRVAKGTKRGRAPFSLPFFPQTDQVSATLFLPVDPPLVNDVISDKGWHMHPYFATTQGCNPWPTVLVRRDNETIRRLLISSPTSPMRKQSRSRLNDVSYALLALPFRTLQSRRVSIRPSPSIIAETLRRILKNCWVILDVWLPRLN